MNTTFCYRHVQVGLYAFFHRLYGMFPCNFLSYLRIHYSEQQKENNAVFTHTIKPMLNTVKMHPMLGRILLVLQKVFMILCILK